MGNSASIGILFVAFLIAPLPSALADYAQMTLFQMLTRAEIVVTGKIRNITDKTYDLVVDHPYRNAEPKDVLTVQRIDTLRLGDRWHDYKEGEHVVLFADPGATGDVTLTPVGAAGEGELPADATAIYLAALSRPPPHLKSSTYLGGTSEYYRVDAADFNDAITGFFDCYRPTELGRIARLCDDAALEEYRQSSWLAEHLSGIADRLPEGEN